MPVSEDEYDAVFGEIDLAAFDVPEVPVRAIPLATASTTSITRNNTTVNAAAGPSTLRSPTSHSTTLSASTASSTASLNSVASTSTGSSSHPPRPAPHAVSSRTRPLTSTAAAVASIPSTQRGRAQRLADLIAATQEQNPTPSTSSTRATVAATRPPPPPSTPLKRESSPEVWTVSPPNKKRQQEPVSPLQKSKRQNTSVKETLEGLEEELTCPICCDLLALAHLGNPCGHTFCATCGFQWVDTHKSKPTCPICRAKLSRTTPLVSNLAADSVVSRLAKGMADAGDKDWQLDGARMKDWTIRCSKGRAAVAQRQRDAAKKDNTRLRRSGAVIINVDEEHGPWLVPDEGEDDSDYQHSGEEGDVRVLVQQAVRRVATRRARRAGQ